MRRIDKACGVQASRPSLVILILLAAVISRDQSATGSMIGVPSNEVVVPATHFSDQRSAPSIALVYRGGGYPFPNGALW